MREEKHHESGENKSPQSTKQERSHPREIPFRLQSEKRESEEETNGDQQRFKDDRRIIEGHDCSDGVCFEKANVRYVYAGYT
jgi:hypothetical protein